nr:DUF6182 family protein [Variibacter gotjawalensis]
MEKRIRRSGNAEALRVFQNSENAAAAPGRSDASVAIVVMRCFKAEAFASSSLAFASLLGETARRRWLAAFTPTIFLVGNPANLAARFAFDFVHSDNTIAWLAPGTKSAMPLRRLLRLFEANIIPDAGSEFAVRVPGERAAPARHRVYVATAGISGAEYLVHLNHTLAEGVITGSLLPGDEVVVRSVDQLDAVKEDFDVIRVHFDKNDVGRLRAYAGIAPLHGGGI